MDRTLRTAWVAWLVCAGCVDVGETTESGGGEGASAAGAGPASSSASGAGSSSSGSDASSGSAATGGAGAEGSGGSIPSPGNVWFSESFEDLGPEESYGFALRYPQSASTWQTNHVGGQGFAGSGGAHVRIAPCTTDCDTATNQFNTGWVTPPLQGLGKPTSQIGDHVYIRFRIRFDDDARWTVDSPLKHSAKFVLYGTTGGDPNSRVILHLFNPYEHGGCSPGFAYYDPWPVDEWVTPDDWGLGGIGWGHPSLAGHYGAFTAHVNISWDCAPGVLVTHGGNASPLPPQFTGSAPSDGWYHLQFFLKSGDGDAEFKIWANNDQIDLPSSRRTGFSLHTDGWDESVNFGGYWAVGSQSPMGFIVDDLEVGDTFHPTWSSGP